MNCFFFRCAYSSPIVFFILCDLVEYEKLTRRDQTCGHEAEIHILVFTVDLIHHPISSVMYVYAELK